MPIHQRYLRPTWRLRLAVGLPIFLIFHAVYLVYPHLLLWFLLLELLGISLGGLVAYTVLRILTKNAERRQRQPDEWYSADAKRERRVYGPLKAYRLFGHKP